MTTPAVQLDTSANSPTLLLWYYNGVHYPKGDIATNLQSYRNVQSRPQSTNNPLRKDGSRAPSSWAHRWYSSASSPRDVLIRVPGNQYYEGTFQLWRADFAPGDFNRLKLGWVLNDPYQVFDRAVESRARTGFLKKLAGQKFDLGTNLAEFRETVTGVADLGIDVLRALHTIAGAKRTSLRYVYDALMGRNLSKYHKRGMRNLSKEIRQQWMKYQMAYKPTLHDIDDATQVLDDAFQGKTGAFTVVCRSGFKSADALRTKPSGSVGMGCTYSMAYTWEWRMSFSCSYTVRHAAMRQLSQLGLTNPAAVAWELLQFSWLVDYITTVGDWLNSFTAAQGLSFLEGSQTQFLQVNSDGDCQAAAYPGSGSTLARGGGRVFAEVHAGRMLRTVLTGSPSPAVFPTYRNRLNLTRLANSLTALSQLRK